MASSTARSGECEPRTGTLVFAPVGSARLTREGTTNEDAPGHASAVAVSGKYGYVVVAHGDAARVMRTHEVAGKVAEWRAREAPASERALSVISEDGPSVRPSRDMCRTCQLALSLIHI